MSSILDSICGFEVPLQSESEDFLDRSRIANTIFRTITNAPPNWSMRIGIHAGWGEGKTTVMNFVNALATQSRYFTVWYSPWSVNTVESLRETFAEALIEQLKSQNASEVAIAAIAAKLHGKQWGTTANALSTAHPILKAICEALKPALEQSVAITADDLSQVADKLDGNRVIVFIDDLDRTDPTLLPQLLLALRDVLDIPRFVFILAFDDKIVSRSLESYNPAWGQGGDFLEKILDFRFVLPAATTEQKARLVTSQIDNYCSFVPKAELVAIADVLPSNPRKLKAVVRNLSVLGSEIQRNRVEDVSWTDLLFGVMVRLESSAFFDQLFQNQEQFLSTAFEVFQKDAGATRKTNLDNICKSLSLDDQTRMRLEELTRAWRNRRTDYDADRLYYYSHLGLAIDHLTKKELAEAFELYSSKGIPHLKVWLKEHARRQQTTEDVIVSTFLEALISYRGVMISHAADQPAVTDVGKALCEALKAHELISAIVLRDLPLLTTEKLATPRVFKRILAQALDWIHFTNDGHDAVRKADRDLLLKIVRAPLLEPRKWLAVLAPWNGFGGRPSSNYYEVGKQVILCNELERCLLPQVVDEALGIFKIPLGFNRVFWEEDMAGLSYVLFNKKSCLWEDPGWTKILALLDKASDDPDIHENCHIYLAALVDFKRGGVAAGIVEDPRELLVENGFLVRLWKATISRPIQVRWHQQLNKIRAELIERRVPESDLPRPEWLAEQPPARSVTDNESA